MQPCILHVQPCIYNNIRDTYVVNIYIFIYFIGPLYLSLVNTKRELVDGLLVRTEPISVQEKYLIRFVQVFTLFRLFSN